MSEILAKITKMGEKVESLKEQQSVAKGRLQAAEEELKGLGFDSVEEAEKWVAEEEKKISKLEEGLANDIAEFQRIYADYLS